MFSLFKKRTFHIQIYTDRLQVKYLEKHKKIDRISLIKFSNKRMVLANFDVFESFLSKLLNELISNESTLFSNNTIVFQVMEKLEDGISEVEFRAIVDSGIHVKGNNIKVYTKTDELSDIKIIEIANSKFIRY